MYLQHHFHSFGNLSAINSYRGCSLLTRYLLLLLCCPIILLEDLLYLSAVPYSQHMWRRRTAHTNSLHMLAHIHINVNTDFFCIIYVEFHSSVNIFMLWG